MSERQRRLFGASVGGTTSTVLDVLVLALLVRAGVDVALAAFLGAAAGAGLCFVVNKYVAFRDHRPIDARQVMTFAAVAFGTALFMAVTMHVACVHGHVPYLVAKLFCGLLVFACWSYPAQRHLVFAA
jgi:putative flippase GtrA